MSYRYDQTENACCHSKAATPQSLRRTHSKTCRRFGDSSKTLNICTRIEAMNPPPAPPRRGALFTHLADSPPRRGRGGLVHGGEPWILVGSSDRFLGSRLPDLSKHLPLVAGARGVTMSRSSGTLREWLCSQCPGHFSKT